MPRGQSISNSTRTHRLANAAAAAQTDVNGSSVNMIDGQSVKFDALIGAVTGGGTVTLKAQQSSDNGSLDAWADITGATVQTDSTGANKVLTLEVVKPTKQYVRPVVVRATQNSVIDGILAHVSGGRKLPPQTGTNQAAQKVSIGA